MRRTNVLLNLFELWVGFAAVVGGLFYFVQPSTLNHTALGHEIGFHLALIWSVLYLVSGCGILVGLVGIRPRIEIAGLILIGTTTAINGIAVLSIFGAVGVSSFVSFLALTAAAWGRAVFVWRSVNKYAAGPG